MASSRTKLSLLLALSAVVEYTVNDAVETPNGIVTEDQIVPVALPQVDKSVCQSLVKVVWENTEEYNVLLVG